MIAGFRRACFVTLLALTVAAIGCDKVQEVASSVQDKAGQITDDLKEKGQEAIQEVKEEVKLAGHVELTLQGDLKTKACYYRLLPQGSGRPAVLQLRSYRSPQEEEFPSVFLQARVTTGSVEALVGQVVSARLFVQPERSGPTWYSDGSGPVELKILELNETTLEAELAAELRNTQTGATAPVTARFSSVP